MFTVTILLLMAAFVTTIANGTGRCPSWVPLMLICLLLMLQYLPK